MASLSREYLLKEKKDEKKGHKNRNAINLALNYGTTADLMVLLIGNERDLDRIPVLYVSEGTA